MTSTKGVTLISAIGRFSKWLFLLLEALMAPYFLT